jgi:uncharacterized protein YraI
VTLVLTLVCGALVVTTSPAAAAACGDSPPNHQDLAYGWVNGTTSGVNLRTGPWTSCSIITVLPEGTLVYFSCYERGTNVNGNANWTYVDTYYVSGWVSNYYLWHHVYGRGFGSFVYCTY